jgi:hypothetical protein
LSRTDFFIKRVKEPGQGEVTGWLRLQVDGLRRRLARFDYTQRAGGGRLASIAVSELVLLTIYLQTVDGALNPFF